MGLRGPVPKMPVVIPTLRESLDQLVQLPEDIRLIRKEENLGFKQLAQSFGVSKVSLYYWQLGIKMPREPLIVLCIIAWAERIKERQNHGKQTPNLKG